MRAGDLNFEHYFLIIFFFILACILIKYTTYDTPIELFFIPDYHIVVENNDNENFPIFYPL